MLTVQECDRSFSVASLVAADKSSTDPKKRPLEQRFWSQVEKTPGCWLWKGLLSPTGYGRLMVGSRGHRRSTLAHQLALFFDGRTIPAGMVTRHTCNTPACVRASHLLIGTQAENNADKALCQRQPFGEASHNARLTDGIVLEIRRSKEKDPAIAARLGVATATVTNARLGRTWRHLPGLTPAPSATAAEALR